MDGISNKYFSNRRGDWEAMSPPSLFKAYQNISGQLFEFRDQVSIVYSVSLFVLNFFGNLHNSILAKDHHGLLRLLGATVVSLACTVVTPVIGLVETVLRLIPALGFFTYYRFLVDEGPKDGELAHQFVLGTYAGVFSILEGARCSYYMVLDKGPYLSYDHVGAWLPSED